MLKLTFTSEQNFNSPRRYYFTRKVVMLSSVPKPMEVITHRCYIQAASKVLGHRKNEITFTSGNGLKLNFQNY